MERFICIHGHFYQPPRENPWLEMVEIQDSAFPYHDWNERITAECYAPNTVSRYLDNEGRIMGIVSNYARMSFNFGPTLLSWMEKCSPEVYQAILESDRQSIQWRSGHGAALAQVYNHMIMPLANAADKRTQVLWGIKDFEARFKRFPEGMWLAETAVDVATLEVLAETGIRFTVLAQHQAARTRRLGNPRMKEPLNKRRWTVPNGAIDPSRAYLCNLPSGRSIVIFFYDGPISHAVAFDHLLTNGENFANRLVSGFSNQRDWPQLVNIATDGETYGHHQSYGNMALGYAINYIEAHGLARLTNYGEYLELNPPDQEVQIVENSSWSCSHGIERWRSDCGCNTGGNSTWHQRWRQPVREALDWLRDEINPQYEALMRRYVHDPWAARDDYCSVVLDRSNKNVSAFIHRHAVGRLNEEGAVAVLTMLEMQRHLLYMYTSCGWFFDEVSGIEMVQNLQYAGRAIQLACRYFQPCMEQEFLERLAPAESNLPERRNAAVCYEKFVRPTIIGLITVGAHYAISCMFNDYGDYTEKLNYQVTREDHRLVQAGQIRMAVGRICIRSITTHKVERFAFCTLHFGGHSLNDGVCPYGEEEAYQEMKQRFLDAFEQDDFAEVIRLMEVYFGEQRYTLKGLFRDEQRQILQRIVDKTLHAFEENFIHLYGSHKDLIGFLRETGMPVPRQFVVTAEMALNVELRRLFSSAGWVDLARLRNILETIDKLQLSIDAVALEFTIRRRLESIMSELLEGPQDLNLLRKAQRLVQIISAMPVSVNLWHTQKLYWDLVQASIPMMRTRIGNSRDSDQWCDGIGELGRMLHFNVPLIMTNGQEDR